MIDIINKRISDYLGFDVSKLINQHIDATIFGGAIRDSIANMEIHDIDILALPKSFGYLANILIDNGYEHSPDIKKVDIENLYQDIHIIHEPYNYLKIVDGKIRLVQLIRPSFSNDRRYSKDEIFNKILHNVDLSNCGVYYNYNGLYSINDAYYHCRNKSYDINNDALMYNLNRTLKRINKLEKRGWRKLDEQTKKSLKRIKKLDRINKNKTIFKNINIKYKKKRSEKFSL